MVESVKRGGRVGKERGRVMVEGRGKEVRVKG